MSCKDCDNAFDVGQAYFYRWKNAIIALYGCRTHIKEVMQVLNEEQEIAFCEHLINEDGLCINCGQFPNQHD